ncbi:MAG TPA: sigma-70 family RNA polymerase sigma factor, partial [Acidimicrobiales bacterium]|nr:sigma-70 family RNA polymerase sigma factor [Acidimicrobiales bacterium]
RGQQMITDADLVDRVVAGFDGSFEELYKRHSPAAWRLAQSVTGNAHDAADAVSEAFAKVLLAVRAGRLDDSASFRSYLLSTTRNAALDGARRSARTSPTDQTALLAVAAVGPSAAEHLSHGEDASLVAEAFRNLPERWRSVLWLTEVEGVTTKDAAVQLGISANGAAQLAVRARAGLRERFLQAHLRATTDPSCRFTVDRLGAYVGGGLSPRDLAKVDQHLAGCADCEARKAELEDLGPALHRIALPIPLVLGAVTAERVGTALAATPAAAVTPAAVIPGTSAAARAAELVRNPAPWMEKLVAASAAGVLALGAVGAMVAGDGRGATAPQRELAAPATAERAPAPLDVPSLAPSLGFDAVMPSTTTPTPPGDGTDADDLPRNDNETDTREPGADPQAAPIPAEQGPEAALPVPTQPGSTTEPPADGEPVAEVSAGLTAGPLSVSTTLSDEGAGLTVGDTTVGDEPAPAPEDDGVEVNIGGAVLPATRITLP